MRDISFFDRPEVLLSSLSLEAVDVNRALGGLGVFLIVSDVFRLAMVSLEIRIARHHTAHWILRD